MSGIQEIRQMKREQDRRKAIEGAEDAKIEKHFRSHKELPNGRNFTCFNHTPSPRENQKYREGIARIFPNSPGADI